MHEKINPEIQPCCNLWSRSFYIAVTTQHLPENFLPAVSASPSPCPAAHAPSSGRQWHGSNSAHSLGAFKLHNLRPGSSRRTCVPAPPPIIPTCETEKSWGQASSVECARILGNDVRTTPANTYHRGRVVVKKIQNPSASIELPWTSGTPSSRQKQEIVLWRVMPCCARRTRADLSVTLSPCQKGAESMAPLISNQQRGWSQTPAALGRLNNLFNVSRVFEGARYLNQIVPPDTFFSRPFGINVFYIPQPPPPPPYLPRTPPLPDPSANISDGGISIMTATFVCVPLWQGDRLLSCPSAASSPAHSHTAHVPPGARRILASPPANLLFTSASFFI